MAIFGLKTSFLFIAFFNPHPIVGINEIQLDKTLGPS